MDPELLSDLTSGLQVREVHVRAVDQDKREVSGIAVPWDTLTRQVYGYGEVIQRGAVQDSDGALLLWRHDEPIGKVLAHKDTEAGWEITARLSTTPRAEEAYTLLRDGVITSFSIGFENVGPVVVDEEAETITRTAIQVREVSLVPFPAYQDAKVKRVRESVDPTASSSTPTRKETRMDPELAKLLEGLTEVRTSVEDVTRKVDTLGTRSTTDATTTTTGTRSFGEFVKAVAAGDETATRAYTGHVTGDTVIQDAWLGLLVKEIEEAQTVVGTFQRGVLPSSGMNVDYGLLDTDTLTVAEQLAQGDDLAYGKISFTTASAPVRTFGGWTDFSRQSIERSTLPVLEFAFRKLAKRYGQAVEGAARAALNTAIAAAGTYVNPLATQDDIVKFLVDVQEQFRTTGNTLGGVFIAGDVFRRLLAIPSEDKVLQIRTGLGNALGTASVSSLEADVANVRFRVLPGAVAGSVAAYDTDALQTLQSPGAPVRLQDENIVNLTKQFSVYGYASTFVQDPDGLIRVVPA